MKRFKLLHDFIVPGLFIIYIYAVFKVILFKFGSINIVFLWQQLQRVTEHPDTIVYHLQLANFIPLKSIMQNIQGLSSHDLVNLVGNIVIFMPFGGFLLILKGQKISFRGMLIRSFGFSLCLECMQLVLFMGTFDVDDLILNTTGGLLGYGVVKLFFKSKKSGG
ncbi:VanZ family protein [Paenibacillus puldeungensis]|uniref:VanZ family protein n=1 Tax=Paenibacillus puldeungensis TaxID=696536 RepID=A0ABW3RXE8_9BACL